VSDSSKTTGSARGGEGQGMPAPPPHQELKEPSSLFAPRPVLKTRFREI
jgi:hypothetical protein